MNPSPSKLVVGARFDDMFCMCGNYDYLFILCVKTVPICEDFYILWNLKDMNISVYQYHVRFTHILDLKICSFSSKLFVDKIHVFILIVKYLEEYNFILGTI